MKNIDFQTILLEKLNNLEKRCIKNERIKNF